MRGRIGLFIVLAVAVALVGVYIGWSTTTTTAVGQPSTTTPADPSVSPAQRRRVGSEPARSPATSSQQMGHKAGRPTTAAYPGGNAQPGQQPTTPPASPPPSTGPVRFGKVTTTPSAGVVTSVAPSDRRALTTTFDDREVQVSGNETSSMSRSFSMTLPLTDGAKGETLKVYVQGTAFATTGAYARLTLKLNGQATIRYYRSGFEDTFVEALEVPATPATTYRLSGVLEVHRNPGSDGAYLDVLSIDASIDR
jgi:hypothetical protein